jgi:hypothetical protein
MTIQILIPTYKKSEDDLLSLCKKINLQSDALIANQNNNNRKYELDYNGFHIHVIESDTVGVSVNRNILLKNFTADFGIFIDDDCEMVLNYPKIIDDTINKCPKAQAILFNGERQLVNGLINKRKKSINIKHFQQISYAGCPGLGLRKIIQQSNIKFDERIGTPNYLYAGEDSLFLKELINNKINIFSEIIPIFKVIEDVDNSSYFKGYDEQYIVNYGASGVMIHPKTHCLYTFYRLWRLKKRANGIPFKTIKILYKRGMKMGKELNRSK